MRSPARGLALCLSLAVATETSAARAQGRPVVSLDATREAGAETCASTEALADAVRSRLGSDPFRTDAPLRVTVRFSREGRGLAAEIRSEGVGASLHPRTLRSRHRDCSALSSSVAITLALSLDALLAAPAPTPAPPPTPAPTPTPPPPPAPVAPPAPPAPPVVAAVAPPPPPPPPVRPPAPPPAPSGSVRAHLDALVAAGLSPGVVPGISLGVTVVRPRYSIGFDLRGFLPATERREFGSAVVTPLFAGVTGCLRLRAFSGCGLVLAGALLSRGDEVSIRHSVTSPHARAGLRVGYESPALGPLRLRVGVEVHAPMTPTTLRIDAQTAWETPLIAGAFSLGVDASL